jgi:hypothetical protein
MAAAKKPRPKPSTVRPRAKRQRSHNEFDVLELVNNFRPPVRSTGVDGGQWNLAAIRSAREQQMRGQFERPVAMSKMMGADDAIAVARKRRLAPHRSLPITLVAPSSAPESAAVLAEAMPLYGPRGTCVTRKTVANLNRALADHGLAVGYNVHTPRLDGSRVDIELRYWPLEFVRWDAAEGILKARLADGSEVPIIHGDGRWVVFAGYEVEPWTTDDAALLSGSVNVWGVHAFALRDVAKASTGHGNAKVLGKLPPGLAIKSPEGVLMLDALRVLASNESSYGLIPDGATAQFLSNPDANWQIFDSLIGSREKAAARIYLGTDGTLGQTNGAPGVDLQGLFGISNAIVEADLEALEDGIQSGTIDVWAAINFGSSCVAPRRVYLRPDSDSAARGKALSERVDAFNKAIKDDRDNGFVVDQAHVDKRAKEYDVTPPMLPAPAANADEASASAAAELAAAMTAAAIAKCEHGSSNRCRLCGIERSRRFETDTATGETVWQVAWRPIGGEPSEAAAPAVSAMPATPEAAPAPAA